MLLRPATPADLSAVVALLDEAAEWLRERGLDQWPKRFSPDWVAPAVADGEVQLAVVGDEPVGTYALVWADPVIWGDLADHEDAGYVHQLAVARSWAGRGIGERLLDHAGALVAEAGRRWVRLDCVAHNAGLRRYYRGLGFTELGVVTDLPRERAAWRTAARFQRSVG